jgi:hypothetical protein
MDQPKKVTAWSPVEQVLRERVKSSIANFVTALDELIECDSVENRAKLRDMTHWLLRAGARTRIELERIEARIPLPPPPSN